MTWIRGGLPREGYCQSTPSVTDIQLLEAAQCLEYPNNSRMRQWADGVPCACSQSCSHKIKDDHFHTDNAILWCV